MASNLLAMASNLLAMAFDLRAMPFFCPFPFLSAWPVAAKHVVSLLALLGRTWTIFVWVLFFGPLDFGSFISSILWRKCGEQLTTS